VQNVEERAAINPTRADQLHRAAVAVAGGEQTPAASAGRRARCHMASSNRRSAPRSCAWRRSSTRSCFNAALFA
jgi:hypothetical protein